LIAGYLNEGASVPTDVGPCRKGELHARITRGGDSIGKGLSVEESRAERRERDGSSESK
jgi:hypothetical protein